MFILNKTNCSVSIYFETMDLGKSFNLLDFSMILKGLFKYPGPALVNI